ncbi:MAG: S1C family serine protease [Phycisphaerae bacterium]
MGTGEVDSVSRAGSAPCAAFERVRRIASGVALAGVCAIVARPPAWGATPPLEIVRADEARRVAALERASRAVVCVFARDDLQGGGSGVVIDPAGYGLTNFHVVAGFLESRQGAGALSDGNRYPLRVLGVDVGGDIALFKLEGRARFDFAPLGDSDRLHLGQWVAAMGNPFVVADDFTPTVTLGVISGLHRYQEGQRNALEYADCIQVSTSINPGNSGGPLFDLAGAIIGINGRASFEERGRVNVGLGYAVSINQIKRFLPCLHAGRLCEHGALGATIDRSGDELIFNSVQELSPAERAGIELGDELRAFAGRFIDTPNEFNNILATLPSGWPVTAVLKRAGNDVIVTARLERLPVKVDKPYIVDLAVNHAETRRLWQRYRRDDRGAPERSVTRVTWRGRLRPLPGHLAADPASAADPTADTHTALRVDQTPERVVVHVANDERAFEQSAPTAQRAGTDPPWTDARLWSEWLTITQPLLTAPRIEVGWELLGGDEVNGCVAAVIERRLEGGGRVRWKLDFQTAALLSASVGDEQEPERVTWIAERRVDGDGLKLPRRWQRQVGATPTIEILLDALEPQLATGGDGP